MWTIIALASAGVWEPIWQGTVDGQGMPEVALMGVDDTGDTAWLRIGDGARSTVGLWQVDLVGKQIDGRWTAGATPSPGFGALAPLVHDADHFQRWSIVQAHIAGRATWPLVSFGSEGPWFAWEHGTEQGADGVTIVGPTRSGSLGADDLAAVYRPRFHPTEPLVAYTGATARGSYRVVVEHLVTHDARTVEGLTHADHLDWDAHGALWVTASGCVTVVRDLGSLDSIPVACGTDALSARLSPDGTTVAISDWSGDGADADLLVGWFRTSDNTLLGRAQVPGGRSMLALRDDGVLIVATSHGSAVANLAQARVATLDANLQGALHDHWVHGRALMLLWTPANRRAEVGWLDPDQAFD
jgi:hypothetical protein